jgi:hypothetical protein
MLAKVGLRAETILLINMIPLFAGLHLSFLVDCLKINLIIVQCIYCLAEVMSFVLIVFHVLVTLAARLSFVLSLPQNLFVVIVSIPSSLLLPNINIT